MATRTVWQDVYTVEFDKTNDGTTLAAHLLTAAPTYAGTTVGIQGTGSAGAKNAMPLNDHPNYKAPSGNLETEQATGIATRRKSEYNIVQTGEAVQFNLPQNGDAYTVSLFAQLLFQSGFTKLSGSTVSNMTGMSVYKCAQYVSADCLYFSQFVRHLQADAAGASIDLLVKGGICHTLVVSAETGGLLTVEPTIYGAKWDQTNMSGVANEAADSFANIIPLKFQDSTFAVLDIDHDNGQTVTASFDASGKTLTAGSGTPFTTGNGFGTNQMAVVEGSVSNDGVFGVDRTSDTILTIDTTLGAFTTESSTANVSVKKGTWVVVNTPSVSMTFTNNCQFNYYNDDAASNAIVGRLTCEGTFSMPFGQGTVGQNYMINRFLNGQEFLMAWYWGQSNDAVDVRQDYKLQPDETMDRLKNDSAATSSKNYASFIVCARITDYEMSGDNEQMVDVTFQGVTTDFHDAMEMYFAVDSTKVERVFTS